MKVSIIFNSHSGTTKGFANAIGTYLSEKGIENQVGSVGNYNKTYLQSADVVLLGCWTSGLMIFAQHPDGLWKKFAFEMPSIKNKRVGLFTTYKIATGSMFRKMEAKLAGKMDTISIKIKSKGRVLTDEQKKVLDELFVA